MKSILLHWLGSLRHLDWDHLGIGLRDDFEIIVSEPCILKTYKGNVILMLKLMKNHLFNRFI